MNPQEILAALQEQRAALARQVELIDHSVHDLQDAFGLASMRPVASTPTLKATAKLKPSRPTRVPRGHYKAPILAYLQQGGAATAVVIAEAIQVPRPRVWATLQRLVRAGLVTQEGHLYRLPPGSRRGPHPDRALADLEPVWNGTIDRQGAVRTS